MPVIEHTCATCGFKVRAEGLPFGWGNVGGTEYCNAHRGVAALKCDAPNGAWCDGPMPGCPTCRADAR